ncbi:hypothetical protein [Microbulbifer sp.]|uniref:hypothetical protein n=1 Tax=Microbulbifer sp. TaxID=1908541 RepID=UPI00258D6711|nr:hypothetical protein [Microbulbifer sp.]
MQWLARVSSWKVAGIFLAVNFAIQAIMVIGIYPGISENLKPLDFQMNLTAETIQQYLTTIGEDGRALYSFNLILPDMLFPLCYACAYALVLMQLIKGCDQAQSPLQYFPLLPLVVALCDIIENIHILTAIRQFPELPPETTSWLVAANTGKYIVAMIVLTTLTVLGCWFAVIKLSTPYTYVDE